MRVNRQLSVRFAKGIYSKCVWLFLARLIPLMLQQTGSIGFVYSSENHRDHRIVPVRSSCYCKISGFRWFPAQLSAMPKKELHLFWPTFFPTGNVEKECLSEYNTVMIVLLDTWFLAAMILWLTTVRGTETDSRGNLLFPRDSFMHGLGGGLLSDVGYLTIRLFARVFYEQIVNETQPSWLSLVENEGE